MKKTTTAFILVLSLSFYCDAFSRSFSSESSRKSSSGSSGKSYSSSSSSGSSGKSYSGKSYSSGPGSSGSSGSSGSVKSVDSKAASKFNFFRSKENKENKEIKEIKENVKGNFKENKSGYTRPTMSEPKIQETKKQAFYKTYYANPQYTQKVQTARYYYRDSYNPYFMLWLMDRSLEDRAMWAYHHRSDMDAGRYQEMVKKDINLEKRISELEKSGIKKDPNYKPEGVDNDLMYKSDSEIEKDRKIRAEEEAKETKNGLFLWGGLIGILVVIWLFVLRKAI